MYSTDWESSFWRQYKLHPQDGNKSQLKPAQGDYGTELYLRLKERNWSNFCMF